jgi:hypothetical protein
VAIQDQEFGPFRSEYKEVDCPACVLTTTTHDRIHPENSTRVFHLFLDQSKDQNTRVLQYLSRKESSYDEKNEKEIEGLIIIHQNAQRLLKPIEVKIPFLSYVEEAFPKDNTRCRRDFFRFICLIKAVAQIRQFQKKPQVLDGVEVFYADIEDYRVAHYVGIRLLASTLAPVSDRAKELVPIILAFGEGEFTRSDLRRNGKEMEIQVTSNNGTLKHQLEALIELGIIEPTDGGKGKEYKYRIKNRNFDISKLTPEGLIPTPEEIQKRIEEEEANPDPNIDPSENEPCELSGPCIS